jgi:hypothetical protein
MDKQTNDREGGGSPRLNPEFCAELDEILSLSKVFTTRRDPLREQDREELRALVTRMEEFKKKWHIDDPHFNCPAT